MSKLRPTTPVSCLLVDMPAEVLLEVFRLLGAQDLAALLMQGQYLRSVASDPCLWEPHCLARWPGADASLLYAGNWCCLYQARAVMPAQFPQAADKVRALTAGSRQQAAELAAAEQQHCAAAERAQRRQQRDSLAVMAFEEVMRGLFTLGLAISREPRLKWSAEFRAAKRDMAWWLREYPQVVVGFVRSANETLQGGFGSWARGGSGSRGGTAWRRSAIAFLQELGLLSGVHPSVAERLEREMLALDRALQANEEGPSEEGIEGLPEHHWWYSSQAAPVVAA